LQVGLLFHVLLQAGVEHGNLLLYLVYHFIHFFKAHGRGVCAGAAGKPY
jgi:hypothetical protein